MTTGRALLRGAFVLSAVCLLVAFSGCSERPSGEDMQDTEDIFEPGVRRVGPPVAHIALRESGTSVSVDQCAEGCRAHEACRSWSWRRSIIDPEAGLCLFSRVVGEAQPDERSVSGVIAGVRSPR